MKVSVANDKFSIEDVLTGVSVSVNTTDASEVLKIADVKKSENITEITYKPEKNEYSEFKLKLAEEKDSVFVYVNALLDQRFLCDGNCFDKNKGVELTFEGLGTHFGIMSTYLHKTWWTRPDFNTDITKIPAKTQAMLVKTEKAHNYFLPICTDDFKSEFGGNSLKISAGCDGYSKVSGCVLVVSSAENPYKAIEDAFDGAISNKLISAKPRSERKFPEQFKYLGWCTWDAFYHDVSDEKMTEKLEEFKEKDIPVKWLIIDDGWAQTTGVKNENDWKLTSLKEDKTKFPKGLKGFAQKAKKEYGFKSVGVWHSFMGYWLGIEPDSDVYKEHKEFLRKTHSGLWFPDWETDKSYNFWSKWHSYLKAQEIDFLKIDTQGSLGAYLDGNFSKAKGTFNMHKGIEKSVKENFNSNIINCMGLTQENALSRDETPVTRSSDDFFPDKENSFSEHAMQNAYNCLYQGKLYYCDWDMWWTMHESAVRSGVLRAISGGPVYVSDEVGKTNKALLMPLCEDDGKILMCDNAALPAEDCLYIDCLKEDKPLKVFNKAGDVGVLALFGINMNSDNVTGKVKLSDIYGLENAEYVAYGYFSKKYYKFTKDTVLEISLKKNECEIFNFYPVKDGKINLGDTSKYISGASRIKKEVNVSELELL